MAEVKKKDLELPTVAPGTQRSWDQSVASLLRAKAATAFSAS